MFPDAVALTATWLRERLAERGDTTRVVVTVPDARPDVFVRLIQSGASTRSLAVQDAIVTVECWHAGGLAQAMALGRMVQALLTDMDSDAAHVPQDGWIAGPYPQSDPDSGTPRAVLTVTVRVYRTEALA